MSIDGIAEGAGGCNCLGKGFEVGVKGADIEIEVGVLRLEDGHFVVDFFGGGGELGDLKGKLGDLLGEKAVEFFEVDVGGGELGVGLFECVEVLERGLEFCVGLIELLDRGAEFMVGLTKGVVFLMEGFCGGLGFELGFFECGGGCFEGVKGGEAAEVVIAEDVGGEEEGEGEGLEARAFEEDGVGDADDGGGDTNDHEGFFPIGGHAGGVAVRGIKKAAGRVEYPEGCVQGNIHKHLG